MENSKKFIRTAIVYVRAYSKETLNIYDLSEQEKVASDYASKNGYSILKVFREENVSAKNFDRPALKEMLAYIEANKWKVKFLIVTDRTRLSTNSVGLGKLGWFLKTKGIKVISIVQSMLKQSTAQPK